MALSSLLVMQPFTSTNDQAASNQSRLFMDRYRRRFMATHNLSYLEGEHVR